ncbi:N-acetylneuraminate synthase [Thalassotalea sp. 1_MG-2023]|uniref:N-acetylneuraminate synthase n=1 Tax=Thalassotalea sp. 1_MG-2023 TaxID=3062680 RepID=UPI0026E1C176|nr:N-acetylneuraminate synthase [Thalassotalea sp. 1_MG-2023]MDO6426450.1 N-acetylneuraminate synthase [Thalassotalea sp. 1_MG-2023]
MNKTIIIAEAGVNHNGSLELAFQLIDKAVDCGADIVKFQTFVTENLVTKNAKQAKYQVDNIGQETNQWQMLKELELNFEQHIALKDYCTNKGIEYLSTAFDITSLNFLTKTLHLNKLKIPSGELTNLPFVLAHAEKGCDLIVSTGMATNKDIELALGAIAFGLLNTHGEPTIKAFNEAYQSPLGKELLQQKVILLHCTTEYPAPFDEINLNAMDKMKSNFSLPVGYSDHSAGIVVPIAAVAKGACILEKHFTLDKTMEGPDHKASVEPDELARMIKSIRITEKALGSSVKSPSPSEIENKAIVRKSIVAKIDIKQGDLLTQENLAIMRPGTGLEPKYYWELLNTPAISSFKAGELIRGNV